MTPYFVKLVVPYTMFHLFEGPARNMARNGQKVSEAMVALFKGLGLAIGYAVVFPFENARVRMGADIERDRVYRNIRDCLDKMKKTEGKSSFYRGFSLSLLHVQLQYFLASTMYQQASNPESSPVPLPPSLTGFPLFLATFLVSELLLYPLDTARYLPGHAQETVTDQWSIEP